MESINLATTGAVDAPLRAATGNLGGDPAATTVPAADAAEIGAFVAALLAQTMNQPQADTTAAATATTAPVAGVPGALPVIPGRQVLAGLAPAAGADLPPALPDADRAASGETLSWRELAQSATGEATAEEGTTPRLAAHGARADATFGEHLRGVGSDTDGADALADLVTRAARAEPGEASQVAPDGDVQGVQGLHKPADSNQVGAAYGSRPAAALPVNDQALFSERLNQHISVMVGQHAQHARIAVSPPELGPVEVRVTVVGDEATIHLAATHATTREALEEALPRLRAAFADSGIALGNAGVFAEMPEQRGDPRANGMAYSEPQAARAETTALADDAVQPLRMVRLGLVDAFV
ncbi:MAG: flagellar hook-length control protein FliK [Gammaproteobacteria bacterium]|nr:flagellar hook-length control protein FliK [Gammaproteobacteria bacterium]